MTDTKETPSSETIKWYLTELSCQDPESIESNEIEIYGEDEQGREGSCTAEITDIADKAYKRIIELEKTILYLDKKIDSAMTCHQRAIAPLLLEAKTREHLDV